MTEIKQKYEGIGNNFDRDKNTNDLYYKPSDITLPQQNVHLERLEVNSSLDILGLTTDIGKPLKDFTPEDFGKIENLFSKTAQHSVKLVFAEEENVKFLLDGSKEALQSLADLQAEGELEKLLNKLKPDDIPEIKVNKAEFIEDKKIIQKAKLIRDIQEGKVDKKNLSEANLSWANLNGANLIRADLNGANLSGANLIGTDLSGADLIGANLIQADLSGAYLIRADLSWANLSGAYLIRANLSEADLTGANLSGADLSGAYLVKADLRETNLNWAYLSGAYLSGADLREADLRKAYLIRANLTQANLIRTEVDEKTQFDDKWRLVHEIVNNKVENRDLHAQDLTFACLKGSFLYGANLIGTDLTESNLASANLQEADLRCSNLTDADLENANLIGAVFYHAIVKGAKFKNNLGITESLKQDLIARKAIFVDDF